MGKRELPRQRRLPKARWMVVGAVVVAGGVTAGIVLSGSDNRHPKYSPTATQPTAAAAIVSGAAQQLQTLLQHAQASTYHATYSVTAVRPDSGTQTIEVWHAPPNVREDTVLTSGTTTVRTETLSDGHTGQACRQSGGAWACTPLSTAEAAQAGGFATQIVAAMAGRQVAVSTETVGGKSVQCFAVAGGAKVCVDADGIPVLVADADVRYERMALETKIDSGSFTPPTG